MPDFTPEQQQFISMCRTAVEKFEERADQAERLGLLILAPDWKHCARSLYNAIALQEHAFRDSTLAPGSQLDLNHKTEEPQS